MTINTHRIAPQFSGAQMTVSSSIKDNMGQDEFDKAQALVETFGSRLAELPDSVKINYGRTSPHRRPDVMVRIDGDEFKFPALLTMERGRRGLFLHKWQSLEDFFNDVFDNVDKVVSQLK